MKDFFEGLFADFKSRYKNQFIVTFFIVYVGLNWERFLALFYASSTPYEQLIERLSIDTSSFLLVGLKAAIYSVLYLMVSPWISLAVLKIQGGAVRRYRIQRIADEIEILNKKKSLEEVKKDVISLEKANAVAAEPEINSDKNIFNKLVSHLKEQKLRDIFISLEKGSIDYASYRLLKDFVNEALSIENTFESEELNNSLNKLMLNVNELFSLLSVSSDTDFSSYKYNKDLLGNILKYKTPTIESYQSFYLTGKSVFN